MTPALVLSALAVIAIVALLLPAPRSVRERRREQEKWLQHVRSVGEGR